MLLLALILLCLSRTVELRQGAVADASLEILERGKARKGEEWKDQGEDRAEWLPAQKKAQIFNRCGPHMIYKSHEDASRELYGDLPDLCHGSEKIAEHLLVTSTDHRDLSWMLEDFDVQVLPYYVGEPGIHNSTGFAWENEAYLKFMAHYYDCLPDVVLFAHPHRTSYHTFQNLDVAVNTAQWENIKSYNTLHPHGFGWPEFFTDAALNLEDKIIPVDNPDDVDCWRTVNGTCYTLDAIWKMIRGEVTSRIWDELFEPSGFGPLPPVVRATLASEFFVDRETIRSRPRSFYVNAVQWTLDTAKRGSMTSYHMAIAWEMTWHIIFGQDPMRERNDLDHCELFRC